MHKLSHVEAQRVIGVLGETLEKLACLAHVPQRPTSELFQRLEHGKSFQVQSALEFQFQLEEALAVERERGSSTNKDSTLNIEKKLRINTRTLSRLVREDAVACNTLVEHKEALMVGEESKMAEGKMKDMIESELATEREVMRLHDALSGLRDVVFRSLTTTVEDEQSRKHMYQTVSTREKEAEEDRKTLEQQLAIARRNRARMISELDAQVARLTSELTDVRHSFDAAKRTLAKEREQETERVDKEHAEAVERLNAELSGLQKEIEALTTEMEQTEAQMQKKKTKYEAEVNAIVKKYDKDMGDKQAALDNLRNKYDREKDRLIELELHFDKVDEENLRIAQEEEEWARFLKEKYQEERIFDDGAVALQKLWRGVQGRIHFELIAKKLKKGKKGKK